MGKENNPTIIKIRRKTRVKLDALEEFLKIRSKDDTIDILIDYYLSNHQIMFKKWLSGTQ